LKHLTTTFLLILTLLAGVAVVAAQDDVTPSVTVEDQLSLDGTVTIAEVVSSGPGWLVIHADNEGAPGPVIGFSAVEDGSNSDVEVDLDAMGATPVLFAMLHTDDNEVGAYEFGQVDGADAPVAVDGNVVTPAFNVELVRAYNQLVGEDSTVNIAAVATAQDGWIVVHADADGAPGPVLGQSQVMAGSNADISVALEGEVTDTLFPMLHVDTGEAGVYEFGQVEGADSPVVVNDTVATFPITVGSPSVVAEDQMVEDTVTADVVVSDGPGWIVIHADNEGAPGPVIGFSAVEDGTNLDVAIEVDADGLTDTVFPMLHVDTGEIGTYEFGEVEGADGPVMVNDEVLTFPISATGEMMDMEATEETTEDESASAGGETAIEISGFAFGAGETTVPVGTTVTWTNADSAPHTVTADDGSFVSGNMNTGDTFTFTFDEPGTYAYYCEYHGGAGGEGMAATITVEG